MNIVNQNLIGALLQTTRDIAGLVVRPYYNMGGGVGSVESARLEIRKGMWKFTPSTAN